MRRSVHEASIIEARVSKYPGGHGPGCGGAAGGGLQFQFQVEHRFHEWWCHADYGFDRLIRVDGFSWFDGFVRVDFSGDRRPTGHRCHRLGVRSRYGDVQ
jgi:hypothetical protein